MVYLHEIALPQYKSLTGSLGYVSLGIGVVLGILVVAAVIYTVSGGAELALRVCGCLCDQWGWEVQERAVFSSSQSPSQAVSCYFPAYDASKNVNPKLCHNRSPSTPLSQPLNLQRLCWCGVGVCPSYWPWSH